MESNTQRAPRFLKPREVSRTLLSLPARATVPGLTLGRYTSARRCTEEPEPNGHADTIRPVQFW